MLTSVPGKTLTLLVEPLTLIFIEPPPPVVLPTTPGMILAKPNGERKFGLLLGIAAMRSVLKLLLISAFSVLSKGASAVTLTDSEVEPTARTTSTRIVWTTSTVMPCWMYRLNPFAETVKS